MNYVGCKVATMIIWELEYASFIWTMWDVKSYTSNTEAAFTPCFIWTMWDVKSICLFLALPYNQFYMNYVGCKAILGNVTSCLPISFYMNYVGCKVSLGQIWISINNCFIWTMWDVKDDVWLFLSDIAKGFYMNYVGCKVYYHNSIMTGFNKVLYELCGM